VADGRAGSDARPGSITSWKYNKGKAPYAEERYLKEAHRLYGVLDRRLADREFVADDYSVADIAIWPWISRFEWQTIDLNQYPNVKRWYVAIANRPATQKGYKVPKDVGDVSDAVKEKERIVSSE
jgi:GST-like protein